MKDFVPIVMAVGAPLAIVVHINSPYRTLAELVKGAGVESKPLNYGSPGPGNTSHLLGLMLAQASNNPMQAVHYRGEAPIIQDLVSGQVDFAASNIIRTHVEAGTLPRSGNDQQKAVVRIPGCADAPGIGLYRGILSWSGFVAPAGTPQAVVDRIDKSANLALAEPDVITTLTANEFKSSAEGLEIFAKAMSSYIREVGEIGRRTTSKSSSATSRVTL